MASRNRNSQIGPQQWLKGVSTILMLLVLAVVLFAMAIQPARAQSSGTQSPPSTAQQPAQEIPDAPSTVQPPEPKPKFPDSIPPGTNPPAPDQPASSSSAQPPEAGKPAPEPIAPTAAVRSTGPKNQINPKDDLYKISVSTSFVQIPVMVKDADGRRVDGLLPKDFAVTENGKPQTLSYFTSDPFELSVAILLDIGMADVGVQK